VHEEGDEGGEGRESADAVVVRIYEQAELETQVRRLLDFGLDPRRWSAHAGSGAASFRLTRRDASGAAADVQELVSLDAVLLAVRKAGQKGVDVTRYKGLGEMNDDELWDTTMDPSRRTLLRVTLSDGAEADRLFGLLMGESVEPRRDFIERHAHEVVELDV